ADHDRVDEAPGRAIVLVAPASRRGSGADARCSAVFRSAVFATACAAGFLFADGSTAVRPFASASAAALALAFLAASFDLRAERRYSSLPTVLSTLIAPAPITVPYTPRNEHRNAAVVAATPPATICAGRRPDFSFSPPESSGRAVSA